MPNNFLLWCIIIFCDRYSGTQSGKLEKPLNIVLDQMGNVLVRCAAIPLAKFTKVAGINEHGVYFDVNSNGVGPDANLELTTFLSDLLKIKPSAVTIVQGSEEACKTLKIHRSAVSIEEVKEKFEEDIRREI